MNGNTLSILVFTHNHEQFIGTCLQSILSQKCSYEYRIEVYDDCSNDKTVEIIQKIQAKNPNKIELYLNSENFGIFHSIRKAINDLQCKYVIFLDGDDYWCYDYKLQTQINFLENNPEYAGSFHDAEICQLNESKNAELMKQTQHEWKRYSQFNTYFSDFQPYSLIKRNIIPTASLVFRYSKHISDFIKEYKYSALSISWAIELEIIKNSKFKYFNNTWSIYNDHPAGISKSKSLIEFKRNNIRILESLIGDKFYSYYAPEIYETICSEFRMMLKSEEMKNIKKKEFRKALHEYKNYLKKLLKSDIKQLKQDFDVWNCRPME